MRGVVVATLLILGFSSAVAQAPSPWLRAPYLGAVGDGVIAISWMTARPVSIDVCYALASTHDATGSWDETLTFEQHQGQGEVWLRGLTAGATYHYQLVAYEGTARYPADIGSFAVPPSEASPFAFLAYGETRLLSDRHRLVADTMAENEPGAAFAVHVGGLVEAPDEAQYANLFWAIASLARSCPYFPVRDHDRFVGGRYYDVFALPVGGGDAAEQWWSLDYGCVHVIGLDSTLTGSGSEAAMAEQVAWLRHDLGRPHLAGRFALVFSSHPLYSAEAGAVAQALRDAWEQLFRESGVDVVISGGAGGYEHIYHGGIHHLVTAGGGAPFPEDPSPSAAGTVFRRPGVLHYLRLTVVERSLRVEAIPVAWGVENEIVVAPDGRPMDSFTLLGY